MPSFNHYVPQSDGSYRRSTVSDGKKAQAARAPYPSKQPAPPEKPMQPPPPPKRASQPDPLPAEYPSAQSGESILSFLKGLLPRQIDAADLLVISLLLLMNREEGSEGMSPLLTIALYFLL